MRPYVFRSIPHLPVFQDFTENLAWVDSLPVEEATDLLFRMFCESSPVYPQPKGCVAIPRETLLCSCGKLIRTQFFCPECSKRIYPEMEMEAEIEKPVTGSKKKSDTVQKWQAKMDAYKAWVERSSEENNPDA